jgi:hypothetical protein
MEATRTLCAGTIARRRGCGRQVGDFRYWFPVPKHPDAQPRAAQASAIGPRHAVTCARIAIGGARAEPVRIAGGEPLGLAAVVDPSHNLRDRPAGRSAARGLGRRYYALASSVAAESADAQRSAAAPVA